MRTAAEVRHRVLQNMMVENARRSEILRQAIVVIQSEFPNCVNPNAHHNENCGLWTCGIEQAYHQTILTQALEEQFEINLADHDLDGIRTLGQLVALIESRLVLSLAIPR